MIHAASHWKFLGLSLLCIAASLVGGTSAVRADDEPISVSRGDWPWWRGPNRNGEAVVDQPLPIRWDENTNVVWKVPVTGRGNGSPIVIGDQVILQTADPDREVQAVVCYDRATGKRSWETPIHKQGFAKDQKHHPKSTFANSTPACDGQRIYVNFLHAGAIHTTALDRQGHQVWQQKISDYVLHQGFGSCPAIYRSLVIVSADNKGGGAIAGLNRATGEVVWKRDRPPQPNYTSPIILRADNREQMFFIGCNLVTSLDPLTGKTLWETAGATTECVTSTVTDGKVIFSSGGYPKNHLAAIKADGSGQIAWENSSRVYVPSMVIRDGFLYAMLDAGVATCFKAETGEELWKQRVGGTFTSSLVLAGEHIYGTDESGRTLIFAANPKEYRLIAENQLGQESFATPVLCGGRIYHRVAETVDGKRQEFLYCLGVEG